MLCLIREREGERERERDYVHVPDSTPEAVSLLELNVALNRVVGHTA